MGADRTMAAVLVGHDVESLESELMQQLSYRFGLITTQLQQQPATGTQPIGASSRDLYQEVRAVDATIEREPWFECLDVAREQVERVRRHVRHDGRQHVDAVLERSRQRIIQN